MVTTISDNAEKHSNLHFKIIFNWKVIALQCYVGFCHPATYNSSFGSSCTSHILFILFTQPRRYHLCIWCKVTQLCLTLCDPLDCSLPGSSVHSPGKNTGVDCHSSECIWWTNGFEPLISQTFLFLVTPWWMPLSTFLFPLTRHLFLSVWPMGLSPLNHLWSFFRTLCGI